MKYLKKLLVFLLVFTLTLSMVSINVNSAVTKYETVKEDVPVWSGSSSKTNKVYRIDRKQTIVEVVSSTINNAGNKWYKLSDGNWIYSGNVKRHSCKVTMCGQATTDYTQYDSSNHIKKVTTPELCVCKEVQGYVIDENLENHSFNGDVCTQCNYQKEHKHEPMYYGATVYEFEQYDNGYHVMTETIPELCDCGSVVNYNINSVIRPHQFNNENKCTDCDYAEYEYVEVEHTHVESKTEEYSRTYMVKNSKQHFITRYVSHLCDCGHIVELETIDSEKKHQFVDGVCKECCYVKETGLLDVDFGQVVEQSVKGNYSDEVTIAGCAGELIVGEIPVAGTLADGRDLVYDLTNGASKAEIAIDLAAFLPLGSLYKGYKKVNNVGEAVLEVSDNVDKLTDLNKAANNLAEHIDDLIDANKDVDRVINSVEKVNSLQKLSRALEFGGINTYEALKKKTHLKGVEVHHIVEKRFAEILGWNEKDMLSVVLTKDEHKVFTKAWRVIEYGSDYKQLTEEKLYQVASEIYKDYPELLEAARRTIFKN